MGFPSNAVRQCDNLLKTHSQFVRVESNHPEGGVSLLRKVFAQIGGYLHGPSWRILVRSGIVEPDGETGDYTD